MPQVESLADFSPGVITRLFDRNGEVFATYAKEKRVLIEEGEIPPLKNSPHCMYELNHNTIRQEEEQLRTAHIACMS